ncbi:hypothetical protein [Steroidobacter cummioxidans]|uniref:hypothetical protein n=1 Tax=Steroidobacter cummioxidans TaxID=1803913 RepID=UPI000E313BEC|nr:hypothetical protein [Steroidobacter cummioxidans]
MSQSHTEGSLVNDAGAHRIEVESDSLDREGEARPPVLEPALLARIHQLNVDYLELLVAECDAAGGGTQLQHIPLRERAALASLSPRAIRALAELPYTLYSLGFESEHFWDAVCANATASTSTSVFDRYGVMGDSSPQYAFCELALIHAWHVVAANTMAARVVYAMPYATAQRLAGTPLWQLRYIAASYGELMMPRWPTNPAFWPDLIRFAASNDKRRLHTTRLLGTQLIAAELEVACEVSRRDPRAAALASPRLRAKKLQMSPRVASNKQRPNLWR